MKIELSFQGGPVATGSTNSESLICQALRFAGFEGLSGGTEKPSKYSRLGADHLDSVPSFFVGLMLLSSLANSFAAERGVAYFNMGAEYEHLKKASEALWHYQRVPFSVSKHDDVSTSFNCSLKL